MAWLVLLLALAIILAGAELFTNGVEWVGEGFGLSEGAVGSVLAAVGTALPETILPIVAIVGGKPSGDDIGIGAILGAPFMLTTLAMFALGRHGRRSSRAAAAAARSWSTTPACSRPDLALLPGDVRARPRSPASCT